MAKLTSFRDLRVYQKLVELHLKVHALSLTFPKFELYELGSQMRRSSNAAPAILAEGWGSRHTNIYMEAINRSLGEVRETEHHVGMSLRKLYVSPGEHNDIMAGYDACGRMLERLSQSLATWRDTKRTGSVVREEPCAYAATDAGSSWDAVESLTATLDEQLS